MLLPLAFLLLQQQAFSTLSQIDALAQKRDVEGVKKYASEDLLESRPQAFTFLKTGGAYGTGKYGWTTPEFRLADGRRFIVFSTKITSQDIGEQVFQWDGRKILSYLDERDPLGVRIEKQKLTLGFKPKEKKASVTAEVDFSKSEKASSSFIIRMSPQYKVSSVSDKKGMRVPYTQVSGITVLPVPRGKETAFQYKLRYEGIVDLPEYAGSVTESEAMLTNDYWYPMIARQPAPYRLVVTVPESWTTLGQGEAEDGYIKDGQKIVTYRMDMPTVYYSFSAGPFTRVEAMMDDRRIISMSRGLTWDQLDLQNKLQAPVIAFFEKVYGKYPFTRWAAIDTKLYGDGALEAYSFATYGSGWLPAEDPHEPSHTWWGGIIPNTYLNSLWNEGFATFSEGLYEREVGIGNVAERRLAFISDAVAAAAYNSAPMAASGPEIGPASTSLGYGKGGDVMQMLEQELGTEGILKAMRYWIKVHPKGKPGEWQDFEKAVNESTGRNYSWFFDQWVRQKGYPDFSIDDVKFDDGEVRGTVSYKGEPYNLLVDVLLEYPGGERVFTKTRLKDDEDFSIKTRRKPLLVSVDPWRRILRRVMPDESPVELRTVLSRMKRFTAEDRKNWLPKFPSRAPQVYELPEDLSNVFIVGSPETLPRMKTLCDRVGFKVDGDKLTYKGTTIDLDQGAAVAIVELANGKRCAIGLGKTMLEPNYGRAKLVLVDNYGRFLRGETEPKTSGNLTFKL